MVRMIPPRVSPEAPPGEQLVFSTLASAPGTDDWVALHSLGIAEHITQAKGEADFVVMVPGFGVLFIEVKSHLSVSRTEHGEWVLGNSQPTTRGPFEQSENAMYSVRRYLEKQGFDLRHVPIFSGVWFTGLHARRLLPQTNEWKSWQLLDKGDFTDPSAAIRRALRMAFEDLRTKFPKIQSKFDSSELTKLLAALRPKFELVASLNERRRDRETELLSLLDEQYEALDLIETNRRILFEGPAGTGKSLLAVEAAKREIASGGRGRLLCFNRLMGASLRTAAGGIVGLYAGTLHRLALEVTGMDVPNRVDAKFWRESFELASEVLLEEDQALDFLIVDEVQDLCTPEALDFLDLLVAGGLRGGRCLFFGDFDRQAIFAPGTGRSELNKRSEPLVVQPLFVNCRNLPRIGSAIEFMSELDLGYRRYRRQDDGVSPSYHWFASRTDRDRRLREAINLLTKEGYGYDEIVVLSASSSTSAAAETNDPWLKRILQPLTLLNRQGEVIQYTTIHAYKGLESPAVVLTDIESAPLEAFPTLLYVGASRASDRLAIVSERAALAERFNLK